MVVSPYWFCLPSGRIGESAQSGAPGAPVTPRTCACYQDGGCCLEWQIGFVHIFYRRDLRFQLLYQFKL